MSERKINLEEILWKSFHNNGIPKPTHSLAEITQKAVKEAMKEACRQVLELAAENANLVGSPMHNDRLPKDYTDSVFQFNDNTDDFVYEINKQSILNTIKQIEP